LLYKDNPKRELTQEEKDNLSKKFKGKPKSEETKRRMSEAWKLRKIPNKKGALPPL